MLYSLRHGYGLEHSKTSVSVQMAEDDGQPTATVWLSRSKPVLLIKVVTKPVVGSYIPEGKANYFYGRIFLDGQEIENTSPWSHDPQEAVSDALSALSVYFRSKVPYVPDLFEEYVHRVYDGWPSGSTQYWIIEGTHEESGS